MSGRFEIRRCLPMVFVIGLCLFSLADPAIAQQTAAGIVGQVKDESGGVLPGVTVTATSPSLQVADVSDVTNAQGEYRLTPLPIGTYTVAYTLSGFQTLRQAGLRLEIGVVARLDVLLKVGALEETVTVSGAAPVVDVTSTAASTQLTRETLELTPTARNGITSLATQAPGVKGRLDIGGGTVGDVPVFKVFGQPQSAWVRIEGLDVFDARIGATGGNYFDYGTVEEARIQSISNGPDVGSRGVAITMVLKSGGNEFHGGGNYGYTSHRFEDDNINDELRSIGITSGNPLDMRTDYGADLGGRIIRDTLWFYGGGRYRQQRRIQLGGFKPDGTPADAYRGEILVNHKVSYQMSSGNKLVYWGQWAQKYQYGDNVSEFVAWESRSDRGPSPVRGNAWKVEWQGVRGNSLVLSALFGRWTWTSGNNDIIRHTAAARAAGVPQGYELEMLSDEDHGGNRPSTFDQVTLKQAGRASGGGGLTDIWRYDASGTMSWYKSDLFLGNHEFKAGFKNTPYRHIVGDGGRGGAGEYRLIFNNGTPIQIDLYNFPVVTQANIGFIMFHANDSWTIARRLTLDLGIRYQRDAPELPAQCRQAGAWPFAPAACIEEIPFKNWNAITPRLYFSYDVMGNAKTVIKGGWGRFRIMRSPDEARLAHPLKAITSTYRWRDLNGNRNYDPGEVNLDPNGPDFISTNEAGNGMSNPNEKQQGTDQFALTLERQLAQNFAVRLSGVYVRTFNEPRYLNTLRPPEAYNIPITNPDPGPDGVLATADDTGRLLTYYDYPAAYAGRQNELFILTDDPSARQLHKSVELAVTKRISSRWQFLASYSATKNDIPLPSPPLGWAIPFYDPNREINTADRTWEWGAKVSGTYLLPAGVSASANFDHRSGDPQARQVLVRGGQRIPNLVINAEPVGSIRLPNTNVLDIRFDKSFALTGGQRVGLRINFFNALNSSTTLAWTQRAGPSYLRPTGIVSPRIVELGGSYTF